MAFQAQDCTVVIKSVKTNEVEDIYLNALQTSQGFLSKNMSDDNVPEFTGAKMMFCNFSNSFYAAKAVEKINVCAARMHWGDGFTRAATKDKLHTILKNPKKKEQQLFPIFVTGYRDAQPQQLQAELQELYSQYGACWVKANCSENSTQYAFVNFHDFDSALAALEDPRGIKYNGIILTPNTAFDTAWALHVWNEMKRHSRLSFQELNDMAAAGVGTGKKFFPKEVLRPLEHIHHFHIDSSKKMLTWARGDEGAASETTATPELQKTEFQVPAESPPVDWTSQPEDSLVQEQQVVKPMADLRIETVSVNGSEPTECGTPSKYVCPISQQLMKDPVRLSNGRAYDRHYITEYLKQGYTVCPLTQVPINPYDMFPDSLLKAEIAEYEKLARLRGSPPLRDASQTSLSGQSTPSTQSFVGGPSALQSLRDDTPKVIEVTDFGGGGTHRRAYSIGEFLGGGGMGKVYRAKRQTFAGSREDGGVFALKICTSLRGDRGGNERNDREAQNLLHLQHIRHENVVQLFDSGLSNDGDVVLVMEVVEPPLTLKGLLNTNKPATESSGNKGLDCRNLPLPLCKNLMAQILSGMEAVHLEGIAHRDLKPSNVMIQQREGQLRVVIIDFGLSKGTLNHDHTITMAGQVQGTPSYMSPEQIRGMAATHSMALAADVWAMGILFYMMIEGRHPFSAGTSVPPRTEADKSALIQNIQTVAMPPLRFWPHMQMLLAQALEKSLEQRFASAKEMRAAFLLEVTDRVIDREKPTVDGLAPSRPVGVVGQIAPGPSPAVTNVAPGPSSVVGQVAPGPAAPLQPQAAAAAAAAAKGSGMDLAARCVRAEEALLGETHLGEAVKKRIERLEVELHESTRSGGLQARLEAIESELGL
mmetsp:Transcript_13947/g.32822  ORF Transcript_13947/g.32822 Transcript_13947/m.32822 type:complete len:875 (-) Transcript_13947:248-2872(-)